MPQEKNNSLDARLETLLTRDRTARFQLWQPLLLAVIAGCAIVLFAAVALRGAEKGAGGFARFIHEVAQAPRTARKLIYDSVTNNNPLLAKTQRFGGQSGFSIGRQAAPAGSMLVLARYDGDTDRGVIEIVSLDDGKINRSYRPDIDDINQRSRLDAKIVNLKRDFNPRRYLPHHPLPDGAGALVFHGMDSPLVKIDVCSQVVWTLDGVFHHSIERDAGGDYWVPENLKPAVVRFVDEDFKDDAIVKVSPDGAVIFRKSVAKILIGAGLAHIVYSSDVYDPDPIHLNDIQPVLADGSHWRKGDLFLSLRNPSMIALYRPSTDELIWSKQGPWLMQHDVDIISDHEIAVFNNNAVAAPTGERVLGANNVLVYDFATGKTRSPFEAGFERNRIRTKSNGLFRVLSDGTVMVEEQNYGRLIAIDTTGAERWSYVNRAKDGRIYQLGWSRVIEAERSAALKAAYENAACEAQ